MLEIHAIYEIATLAAVPSNRPPLFEGVDDDKGGIRECQACSARLPYNLLPKCSFLPVVAVTYFRAS